MKSLAVCVCLILAFISSPYTVGYTSLGVIRFQEPGDVPDFNVVPLDLGDAPAPDVDSTYRGGVWDDNSLADLANLQYYDVAGMSGGGENLRKTYEPVTPVETATGSSGGVSGSGTGTGTGGVGGGGGPTADTGGGPGFPWEGVAPGGGSPAARAHVVTNTGNRFTTVPLVSWPVKGAYLGVDLTLYHNSKGSYSTMFGCQWSSAYDANLIYNASTNRYVLRWGNGQSVPFNYLLGQFRPPMAIRLGLTQDNETDVTIMTPDMVRYTFTTQATYAPMKLFRLKQIRDRSNVTISISRNPATGYISSVAGPDGRALTFAYYSSGMINTITDPLGRVWTFGFSQGNDLLWIQYPPAQVGGVSDARCFGYDSQHAITSETDLRGNLWRAHYDAYTHKMDYAWAPNASITDPTNAANQLLKFAYYSDRTEFTLPDKSHGTNPNNSTPAVCKQYYSAGRLWKCVDPNGFQIQSTPNGLNQFTSVTLGWTDIAVTPPVNHLSRWSVTYDTAGNIAAVVDPLGHRTLAIYDGMNNPTSITQEANDSSASLTTSMSYTANGQLQDVYDSSGTQVLHNHYDLSTGLLDWTRDGPDRTLDCNSRAVTTSFTYDTQGRGDITRVSTPTGHDDYTYNALGDPVTSTDPAGRLTQYSYDGRARIKTLTRPDSYTVGFSYDHEDLLATITDEKSRVTHFYYDSSQRLSQMTNARGDNDFYSFDHNDWPISVQNGNNGTRRYTYNLRGDVTQLSMPTGAYERWSYGAMGETMVHQHLQTVGATPRTIRYDHNDAFQPTAIKYGSYTIGTDTTFAYDGLGRVHTMTDTSGVTTWDYDPNRGLLSSFANPQGVTLGYSYFSDGRRQAMSQTGFQTTSYDYDVSGRISTIANLAIANGNHPAGATNIQYNPDDSVAQVSRPNSHITTYAYDDPRGRLTGITHTNGSIQLRTEGYTYDEVDDLKTRSINNGPGYVYDYDAVHQLVSESVPSFSGNPPFSYALDYDHNGNRLHKSWSSGVIDTYSYDADDRLLSVVSSGGAASSYTYDSYKRPIQIGTANFFKALAWDVEDRLLSVAQVSSGLYTALGSYGYNGLGARVSKTAGGVNHVYARRGASVVAPVAKDTSSSGIATTYAAFGLVQGPAFRTFASNQLGTHNHEVDGSGAINASREFDAFGNVLDSSGTAISPYGYLGALGYAQDDESGFKCVGRRVYDPAVGRFLTADPAKKGRNWAAYCCNNPVAEADPSGLEGDEAEIVAELAAQATDACITDGAVGATGDAATDAAGELTKQQLIRLLGSRSAYEFLRLPLPIQNALWSLFALVCGIGEEAAFGPGVNNAAAGTIMHADIAHMIGGMEFPSGVSVLAEQNYYIGRWLRRPERGCVRIDCVVSYGGIYAIVDWKFFKSMLSGARRSQISKHLPSGMNNPPVIGFPGAGLHVAGGWGI